MIYMAVFYYLWHNMSPLLGHVNLNVGTWFVDLSKLLFDTDEERSHTVLVTARLLVLLVPAQNQLVVYGDSTPMRSNAFRP